MEDDRKRRDIMKKIEVVKQVINAYDMDKGVLGPDKLFEIYTGYEANPALITETCTYKEYLQIKSVKPENLTSLRQKLYEWYVIDEKPPKFEDIENLRDPLEHGGADKYFYSLAHNGFVWKNIPGTTKALFVEKYAKIASRLRYLIKMKEYRQAERNIIYVEDITYLPKVNHKSYIAVSNKTGVVSLVLYKRGNFNEYQYQKSGLEVPDKNTAYKSVATPKSKELLTGLPTRLACYAWPDPPVLKQYFDISSQVNKNHLEWLMDHVLKFVDEPSVFVLEEFPVTRDDLLHPLSCKQDMKDYLDENNIPYSTKAHRSELYDLIKRLTKPEIDQFSRTIKGQGHDVLLRPYDFNNIDFFRWFWGEDLSNEDFSLKSVGDAEEKLVAEEERILNIDRMMEEVVDKLMTLGKYGDLGDADLTEFSDVIKYDPEYGVGSMFVD